MFEFERVWEVMVENQELVIQNKISAMTEISKAKFRSYWLRLNKLC